MQHLRQSTASQEISLGQFLDSTDGNTEEGGLTIANTDIKIRKHGGTTLINKNSGGATVISNGVYQATLDATDTNTAGMLEIYIHVAGALAVKSVYMVLTATAFDALYTGAFNNLGGVAQTADNDTKISAIPTTAMRGTDSAATAASLATAQLDLDTITGSDGVTLATAQALYAPNVVVPDAAGVAPTAAENRQEMDSNSVDLNSIISNQTTINDNVLLIPTTPMRGTDGANTVVPDVAGTAPTLIEILTTQMTESYAADGAAPTLTQALMLIQQVLTDFSITGVTNTIRKVDGAATAATMTINDATDPTGSTRAT